MKNELKEGDRVWYRGGFGNDKPCKGTIVGTGEKNDRTTYDVDLDNGDGAWGYADQFRKVQG